MSDIVDFTFKYHKQGGYVVSYAIMNQESSATSYYQYLSTDSYWYIMKSVRAGAVTTYSYTVPVKTSVTTLADGWTDRANRTYVDFDAAFA